jgi:hypothetical protein
MDNGGDYCEGTLRKKAKEKKKELYFYFYFFQKINLKPYIALNEEEVEKRKRK